MCNITVSVATGSMLSISCALPINLDLLFEEYLLQIILTFKLFKDLYLSSCRSHGSRPLLVSGLQTLLRGTVSLVTGALKADRYHSG